MAEAKKVIPLPTSKCARIRFLDPESNTIVWRTFELKGDYTEEEVKQKFRRLYPGRLIRKVIITERWKGSNTILVL